MPRVHHDDIVKAAVDGATVTVFVDLQPKDPFMILGIMKNVEYLDEKGRPATGTVVRAGTKISRHPVNLWMDLAFCENSEKIKALVAGTAVRCGCNYAYVTGKAFMYRRKHIPQIQLETVEQIRDAPCPDAFRLHHAGEAYHLVAAADAHKRAKEYGYKPAPA